MMGQLKKFSLQMAGGANIASIIVMLLIGYSGFINPVSFPRLSNIGLLFPLFLLINLTFLILWLIIKPKYSIIPLLFAMDRYEPIALLIFLPALLKMPLKCYRIMCGCLRGGKIMAGLTQY